MPENKKKYDIIKEIRVKYSPKLVKLLIENDIKYEKCKYKDYSPYQPKEYIEEYPLISIDSELYSKLKKISEITGISIENIANNELGHFLKDDLTEEPLIFLDAHLGIKNIKDPLSIIEKLNEVVDIEIKYLEYLKTVDPIEYVEKWYHPSK